MHDFEEGKEMDKQVEGGVALPKDINGKTYKFGRELETQYGRSDNWSLDLDAGQWTVMYVVCDKEHSADPEELAIIEPPLSFMIPLGKLRAVAVAASEDEFKKVITAIRFDEDGILATDSYRIHRCKAETKLPEGRDHVLLPAEPFRKRDPKGFAVFEFVEPGKWKVFFLDEGGRRLPYEPTIFLGEIEGKYPNTKELLEGHDQEAIDRIGIGTRYLRQLSKAAEYADQSINSALRIEFYGENKPLRAFCGDFDALLMPIRTR